MQRIAIFLLLYFLPTIGTASGGGEIIHEGKKEIYFEYEFWFEAGSRSEEEDHR